MMPTIPYYNPLYGQSGAMPDSLNQFKMPYQQAQPQSGSGIIWVQGEAGAKSYLVAPNNTVVLFDSENPVIYIKSADISGMPTMRVLDWVERAAARPSPAPMMPADEYVKVSEFNALKERFDAIYDKVKKEVEIDA
jgi:hypothetical protein